MLLALAIALPPAAAAQDAARPAVPVAMLGMRLGTPRAAIADSTCGRDGAGDEWCSPRPYQHLLVRDGAVVAYEVLVQYAVPDTVPADTVWRRFALARTFRIFGMPDSSRIAGGRTSMWWNWDGSRGPRRVRVTGGVVTDSAGTWAQTRFHVACAPGYTIAACATPPAGSVDATAPRPR